MKHPATWPRRVIAGPAVLAVLMPFVMAGCSDSPSGTDGTELHPPEEAIDLTQEWGGLTNADEPSTFASAEIAAMADLQATVEPLNSDPTVLALEGSPDRQVTFLRVVWGNLGRNDSDSTATAQAIVWDGSMGVTSGAVLIQNLIRFEPGDHIVRPRTSPKEFDFVSRTRGGIDGVLLRLVSNPDSVDGSDVFSFETGPLSVSFPLSSIGDLDSVIMVDDNGNGVAFTAVDDDRRGECAAGMVNGVWHAAFENGGYFRAVWVTPNGFLAAAMRGRFGLTPNGNPVFIGKVIGPLGQFFGFVKGTWTVAAEGGEGEWRGRWFAGDRVTVIGLVGGHWVSREDGGAGFLHGRWAKSCDD